jgi:mRNA interferase RelE/StbE
VAYRLEIMPAAERDLRRLAPAILRRVDVRMRALAEQPRPHGVEHLTGTHGGLRLRVGDYRLLYTVNDRQQVVTIARVRHRGEVYRGL